MKTKNTREMFNNAIANANTIKAMAIENAKQAIAESFTPQIHAMLATKLEEMEKEELEEETELTNESENSEVSENEIEESEEQVDEENANEGVNLDKLLAELDEENIEEELNEDLDLEEAKKKAEDKEESEEEDIDLSTMSEEDLEDFIKGVIKDMADEGELEDNSEEGEEESEDKTDDEEVTIDEILKSLSEENVEESSNIDEAEFEKVKEELNEAKKAIVSLTKTVNETNLLNSKLLYMNKIFKAKNLNESQKVKVLNAFDKAKTVAESKVVYNLLNESLTKVEKTTIKEHKSIASNVITNAKATKKPILENVDPMITRWKKIAGLK